MAWVQQFLDDFNRADGAVGNSWTAANRSPSVLSNQFYDASNVVDSVGGVAVRDLSSADGRCEATIKASSSVTGSCGVVFRWQDTSNYWRAIFPRFTSGDAYYIQRVVAGVFTTPLIVSGNAAINDVILVEFVGDRLELFVNGVSKGTVTDSTGSTRTTHGIYCSASTVWRMDDFRFYTDVPDMVPHRRRRTVTKQAAHRAGSWFERFPSGLLAPVGVR